MIQIILAFLIVGLISFTLGRIGDHQNIKEQGGIRTKYNKIFSYFYNLPNSKLTVETKSYVTFTIKDVRRNMFVRLNYQLDRLAITCKVTYLDDTPFDNGKKYTWEIWPRSGNPDKVLAEIQNTISKLP